MKKKSKNPILIPPNILTIYPNPIKANNIFNVNFSKKLENNQVIEIFSAEGNLVQKENIAVTKKTNSASFLLKDLSKGFYILSVTDSKTNEKISKEFIVQ